MKKRKIKGILTQMKKAIKMMILTKDLKGFGIYLSASGML
jgi:hypothetical protein